MHHFILSPGAFFVLHSEGKCPCAISYLVLSRTPFALSLYSASGYDARLRGEADAPLQRTQDRELSRQLTLCERCPEGEGAHLVVENVAAENGVITLGARIHSSVGGTWPVPPLAGVAIRFPGPCPCRAALSFSVAGEGAAAALLVPGELTERVAHAGAAFDPADGFPYFPSHSLPAADGLRNGSVPWGRVSPEADGILVALVIFNPTQRPIDAKVSLVVSAVTDPPHISSVSPLSTEGGKLFAVGSGFGPHGLNSDNDDLRIRASVGGVPCAPVKVLFPDYWLECGLPPVAGVGLPVNVSLGPLSHAQPLYKSLPPRVTSVTPIPAAGGRVTVRGANFGPRGAPVAVYIGHSECVGARVAEAHAAIECEAAAGAGSGLPVYVNASGVLTRIPRDACPHGPPDATAAYLPPERPPPGPAAGGRGWRVALAGEAGSEATACGREGWETVVADPAEVAAAAAAAVPPSAVPSPPAAGPCWRLTASDAAALAARFPSLRALCRLQMRPCAAAAALLFALARGASAVALGPPLLPPPAAPPAPVALPHVGGPQPPAEAAATDALEERYVRRPAVPPLLLGPAPAVCLARAASPHAPEPLALAPEPLAAWPLPAAVLPPLFWALFPAPPPAALAGEAAAGDGLRALLLRRALWEAGPDARLCTDPAPDAPAAPPPEPRSLAAQLLSRAAAELARWPPRAEQCGAAGAWGALGAAMEREGLWAPGAGDVFGLWLADLAALGVRPPAPRRPQRGPCSPSRHAAHHRAPRLARLLLPRGPPRPAALFLPPLVSGGGPLALPPLARPPAPRGVAGRAPDGGPDTTAAEFPTGRAGPGAPPLDGPGAGVGPPPYVSFVMVSRNDDYGGSLADRLQLVLRALAAFAARWRLAAELLLVEWNPPAGRPGLPHALLWPWGAAPGSPPPLPIRHVVVPAGVHGRIANAERLPIFDRIGMNVGIRRARGEFVAIVNQDVVLCDGLGPVLARRLLRPGRFYQSRRYDVEARVPPFAPHGRALASLAAHGAAGLVLPSRLLAATYGEDAEAGRRRRAGLSGVPLAALTDALLDNPGDLHIMHRSDWHRVRANPEVPMYRHVDLWITALCIAHNLSFVPLRAPMGIFHIHHTHLPAGQRPELPEANAWPTFHAMVAERRPVQPNDEDWGLTRDTELGETCLPTDP